MEEQEQEVIIIPPPEIKGVLEKTAEYVAQVGSSFEAMVYAREKNNPKFQFLMPQSHYHAFYRQQVEHYKQLQLSQPASASSSAASDRDKKQEGSRPSQPEEEAQKEEDAPKETQLEPPAPLLFSEPLPETIQALSLEVVGLVAQHVARNGPAFQQALLNRERNNPMFAFLDSKHAHHEFYLNLVKQYETVLQKQKEGEAFIQQLLAEDRPTVLQQVLKRVELAENPLFFFLVRFVYFFVFHFQV